MDALEENGLHARNPSLADTRWTSATHGKLIHALNVESVAAIDGIDATLPTAKYAHSKRRQQE
jgi:hypothetical protein